MSDSAEPGQQQWCGRITRGRQCRPSEAGKGIDVETELVLFRQHLPQGGGADCPLPARGAAAGRRCAALLVDLQLRISVRVDPAAESLVTQLKALQFSRDRG